MREERDREILREEEENEREREWRGENSCSFYVKQSKKNVRVSYVIGDE